jgi:hypothetical protein
LHQSVIALILIGEDENNVPFRVLLGYVVRGSRKAKSAIRVRRRRDSNAVHNLGLDYGIHSRIAIEGIRWVDPLDCEAIMNIHL